MSDSDIETRLGDVERLAQKAFETATEAEKKLKKMTSTVKAFERIIMSLDAKGDRIIGDAQSSIRRKKYRKYEV